jgi:hypothetical protein
MAKGPTEMTEPPDGNDDDPTTGVLRRAVERREFA